MNKYKTLRGLSFSGGVIALDETQAAKRAEMLEPQRAKDTYLIISPVQFKAGEIIGLETLPKAYIESLEPVKVEPKKK